MNPGPAVQRLLDRGVVIPQPWAVQVGDEVRPERIAPGAVLHPGCRLFGEEASVGPGCVLGEEAPVVVRDCQLGHGVRLRGGSFEGATFLDGSAMGSGAHVRRGTLLEEEAGGAHTVGLKQTLLFPFVQLGSLINFCDCFMAGGRNRKDHSEVGSSYVHFNFTPHQDKATPSLLGDVPRGVMLDQPPIFLGGQGGLVGPARITFGTVLPAGAICREDVEEPGRILFPRPLPGPGTRTYETGAYGEVSRIVRNNLAFIGNLRALRAWYDAARLPLSGDDAYRAAALAGARKRLDEMYAERVRRLGQLAEAMPGSLERLHDRDGAAARSQRAFASAWPRMPDALEEPPPDAAGAPDREAALTALNAAGGGPGWVDRIARLDPAARAAGTRWLQAVVDTCTALWQSAAN